MTNTAKALSVVGPARKQDTTNIVMFSEPWSKQTGINIEVINH